MQGFQLQNLAPSPDRLERVGLLISGANSVNEREGVGMLLANNAALEHLHNNSNYHFTISSQKTNTQTNKNTKISPFLKVKKIL